MSLKVLAEYAAALEQYYELRRQPEADARAEGGLLTRMRHLRDKLSLTERLAADRKGLELNREYRRWLARQPEEPPPCRPNRDETTAPRPRPLPTTTLPGSGSRVAELERRRRLGMDLFSDADADEDPRYGLQTVLRRNGTARGEGLPPGVGLPAVREAAGGGIGTADPLSRLRKLREAAGLTRQGLARRSGLSLRCVALLETGRRRYPRPETLAALADALGVSVDELLGRRPCGRG